MASRRSPVRARLAPLSSPDEHPSRDESGHRGHAASVGRIHGRSDLRTVPGQPVPAGARHRPHRPRRRGRRRACRDRLRKPRQPALRLRLRSLHDPGGAGRSVGRAHARDRSGSPRSGSSTSSSMSTPRTRTHRRSTNGSVSPTRRACSARTSMTSYATRFGRTSSKRAPCGRASLYRSSPACAAA